MHADLALKLPRVSADNTGMLLGVAFLMAIATVPLAGGRLGALAELRLRAAGLLLAAISVQVLIISIVPSHGSGYLHAAAHIATYCIVGAFVFVNRDVPYLWLVALGGALNFVAIAANGGVMPASPEALDVAGIATTAPNEFANSAVVADPKLTLLGDIFAVPASLPASNVFSIGDIVIVTAAFIALHRICGSRLRHGRRAATGAIASPRRP